MKTINNIIENSALSLMSNYYRYSVVSLFSGILITVVSLLVFMFGNMDYVSACFNF
ncbi:hypothetical protein [Maribacter halichondriae]|uniref:hypothetical protein n=1 Tax=Maribacter halichondriae TaxID=2980554 RepID=UPI00235857F3|nr:hypothetical protein [Maribacter sp. Hal144]